MTEQFIAEMLKFAPAIAVLLWVTYRQQKLIEGLTGAVIECYKSQECLEDDRGS